MMYLEDKNMVECSMPQDILKRKSKFIANFSAREVLCASLGLVAGVFCYFSWCKNIESQDIKMLISSFVILPFFLIGFIKVYDQPFEKLAPKIFIENFVYPLKRKKETHFKEFEKYEASRYWIHEDPEETDAKGKKKKKKAPEKITVQKSATYRGIK